MNVTAAYVVLRAAVERALHPADPHARRPRGARTPPAPAALIADASVLASSPALARISCARRGRGDAARTRRPPRGGVGRGADRARRRPASGAPHRARELAGLPGLAPRKGAGRRPHRHRRQPAARRLRRRLAAHADRARGFTATVADGATRGAMFAWDVAPAHAGGGAHRSVAVLSLYPRLETLGYVPRKFIAAEPLLEHGMSLAVGYADAMSMARALATTR